MPVSMYSSMAGQMICKFIVQWSSTILYTISNFHSFIVFPVTGHLFFMVMKHANVCSFSVPKRGMPDLEKVVPCSIPVGVRKPDMWKEVHTHVLAGAKWISGFPI